MSRPLSGLLTDDAQLGALLDGGLEFGRQRRIEGVRECRFPAHQFVPRKRQSLAPAFGREDERLGGDRQRVVGTADANLAFQGSAELRRHRLTISRLRVATLHACHMQDATNTRSGLFSIPGESGR